MTQGSAEPPGGTDDLWLGLTTLSFLRAGCQEIQEASNFWSLKGLASALPYERIR